MTEILTNKLNPYVLPHLNIWHYEIPLYLFLGGIAGGLLILSSGRMLFEPDSIQSRAVRVAAFLSPALLGLGMLFLFLDLEYKFHVLWFYAAFVFTSPMSWGSWMLLLFFPFSILQAVLVFRNEIGHFPAIQKIERILTLAQRHFTKILVVNVHLGTGVGVYTGVLLSTFYARPLWNSSVLGFVFLLSGLSSAAALMLLAATPDKRRTYAKTDMYLISLEGFAATLFIIGGITSAGIYREAMLDLISGNFAPWFWVLFVLGGLIVPLLLETLESLGKVRYSPVVPVLVLVGSLSLRFILVNAGQQFATYG